MKGNITPYVWDRGRIVADLWEDKVASLYYYGADGIAVRKYCESEEINVHLKNVHGDVMGVTDERGYVIERYRYDAFGNNLTDDTTEPFGYCGEYFDDESGLIYLRNRYYDPETGRFITEDPAKDGVNWYSYASNDPVNFIDPWGLAIQLSNNNTDILFDIMKNESGRANRIVLNSDNTISMADGFSLENASYGEKLIYDLINWDKMITLKMGEAGNANVADFINNEIALTSEEVLLTTLASDGRAERTYTTPWIRMAHELIHLWDQKNKINTGGTGLYTYIGEGGNKITVMNDPKMELAATGINYSYSPKGVNQAKDDYSGYVQADLTNYITENVIRAENGLPERVTYNNIDSVITYSGSIFITNLLNGTSVRKYFFN